MPKRDWFLERLGRMPIFAACSKRELALIGRQAEDITFGAGRILVREGEAGSELFVIVNGQARVSVRGRGVAELGPGDYFGELALLDPAPREATVTAVTPLEALVLGRREFATILAESPTLSTKLMTGIARRLREADSKLNA